jgi:cation diffusion facilitator CzcD-associated flavoprotein CzcO
LGWTLVVGGGQAGLAVSHELTRNGVEHVVLEQGHIGQSWRDRWESFCLVTPNWVGEDAAVVARTIASGAALR